MAVRRITPALRFGQASECMVSGYEMNLGVITHFDVCARQQKIKCLLLSSATLASQIPVVNLWFSFLPSS